MGRARSWKSIRDDTLGTGALDSEQVKEQSSRMRSEVQAEHLAELRRRAGITQSDVAANLGVSQAYVSMLEHGDIESVKYGLLRQWVESLGGRAFFVAAFHGLQANESVVVLPFPMPTFFEEITAATVGAIFSSDQIEHSISQIERFELTDA